MTSLIIKVNEYCEGNTDQVKWFPHTDMYFGTGWFATGQLLAPVTVCQVKGGCLGVFCWDLDHHLRDKESKVITCADVPKVLS